MKRGTLVGLIAAFLLPGLQAAYADTTYDYTGGSFITGSVTFNFDTSNFSGTVWVDVPTNGLAVTSLDLSAFGLTATLSNNGSWDNGFFQGDSFFVFNTGQIVQWDLNAVPIPCAGNSCGMATGNIGDGYTGNGPSFENWGTECLGFYNYLDGGCGQTPYPLQLIECPRRPMDTGFRPRSRRRRWPARSNCHLWRPFRLVATATEGGLSNASWPPSKRIIAS
jgi:hypothetical protein